ncbi:dTDP-fucopyranose mutase [Ophidiomyces ophidiicola]|nr:dTDP-fucopyranose mutase [Ophidiomyces ophidiicola]KAI1941217.1 dTDP-fucopyranose mutase [Ophidiomyces ophidiicola]
MVLSLQPLLDIGDDKILSDDKIQALLLEAEQRLLQKSAETNKGDNADNGHLSLVETPKSETRVYIPKLRVDQAVKPYVQEVEGVASLDESRVIPDQLKKLSDTIRSVEQPGQLAKAKDKPTSGPDWFDLPKTVITPELKRDLQILRMRNVLDPKRHYKKENGKAKLPEYSQVGTIIEGATEFFSSRIAKRDRKKTFVEEAMVIEQESGRFKRKYNEIQDAKTSGKKAFYKGLQAKRKRSQKKR